MCQLRAGTVFQSVKITGTRYPIELWVEGHFAARAKMTVSTFHGLHRRGRRALVGRVLERLLWVEARNSHDELTREDVSVFVRTLLEAVSEEE